MPNVISHGWNDRRTDRPRLHLLFDFQGVDDPSAHLTLPDAIAFLGTLHPQGLKGLMERNRELVLTQRDRLCRLLGIDQPAPDSMIGSMAAVPLPPAGGEPSLGLVDELTRKLRVEHLIQVPVFIWPEWPQPAAADLGGCLQRPVRLRPTSRSPARRPVIAVITGGSGGIGGELVKLMAGAGHEVTVLGRGQAEGADAGFVECDLSDLGEVQAAAHRLREQLGEPDVLINNAGVAAKRGLTAQGFEWTFGVNYLAHFLLTRMLPVKERVVHVTSEMHRSASRIDLDQRPTRPPRVIGWSEYAHSKACQLVQHAEMSRRGLYSVAVHPGVLDTGIYRNIPGRSLLTRRMAPPTPGALTVMRGADRSRARLRLIPHSRRNQHPSAFTTDTEMGSRLWEQSEEWVSLYLDK